VIRRSARRFSISCGNIDFRSSSNGFKSLKNEVSFVVMASTTRLWRPLSDEARNRSTRA
jgi:hypothetical protein